MSHRDQGIMVLSGREASRSGDLGSCLMFVGYWDSIKGLYFYSTVDC